VGAGGSGCSSWNAAYVDAVLRAAVSAQDVPSVVVMAATETGVVYEGVFGSRRIHEGRAMTRDTIFRVANGEADHDGGLRLVERGKLSLEAPVPDTDPVLAEPQVLDGFDPTGKPVLRPAKRPIALHDLLTHTAGFVYAMGQCGAENITRPSTSCRPPSEASCCTRR
jgi:methyl acetate hydrolase